MIRFNRIAGVLVASMAATALAGCAAQGADETPEDVAQAEQAFGIVSCGLDAPSDTFVGGIDYLSDRDYNQCYKGVIVDVSNYETGFTVPKPSPSHRLETLVTWEDTYPGWSDPNHEATCESLWMQSYLYEEVNGVMEWQETQERHGVWDDTWGCLIGVPPISFDTPMQAGHTYRIAATARQGSQLRMLRVRTQWIGTP
ncbi:hypothetical protein [Sorangium sp. So ce341]|uniref:hypothetical protein n=1 Tax=Sorangium sp. So ce341 TaxID=3133302 RepID=UPI003F60861A